MGCCGSDFSDVLALGPAGRAPWPSVDTWSFFSCLLVLSYGPWFWRVDQLSQPTVKAERERGRGSTDPSGFYFPPRMSGECPSAVSICEYFSALPWAQPLSSA